MAAKKTLVVLFVLSLAIIVGVSAVDAYLNIKYPPTLASEENPVARALIYVDGGMALLIALKLFGTAAVASFLTAYSFYKRWSACVIASVVATFQVGVLIYLLAS